MAIRVLTDVDQIPDLGDLILIPLQFFDLTDNRIPKDPTSVRYLITATDPDSGDPVQTIRVSGVDTTITRNGVGDYAMKLFVDTVGKWSVRGEGSGAVIAADTVQWTTPPDPAFPTGRWS